MAVMEGSLSKWTNVMKGWQYRWFVLDENSGLLSYYTSKEKMMRGVRRGCVRLKGAVIGIDDEDDSTFTITVDHKTFHFQARDAEEREKWVRALEDTIFRHGSRMRWDNSRPPPTMKDFDHKVSEADAYLQLMIEQTKNLEDKIDNIEDQQEKAKCQLILEHANAMLNDIKHSIVLLQIAKNTAHPINGIYQQHLSISTHSSTEVAAGLGDSVVQQGVELGSECTEGARRRSTINSPPSLAVPVMSYSSSEEEEDFFDADDSPFSPLSQIHSPTLSASSSKYYSLPGPSRDSRIVSVDDSSSEGQRTFSIEEQLVAVKASTGIQANVPKADQANSQSPDTNVITDNGCVDYDALYEDEMETDVHIESQGSVIKHLLSQVKIGMDLTKVVLPTFILERRSLLEMYADYFAHPDLFVRIADLKDPRDRMVQVVRWYLSSYHAGRKSAVAKKPYNPILGEVFYCLWDIPETEQASEDATPDGPIPWCKSSQLSFVAEQVSHHPPISAFYAEHYNKRITFNAHIYTKSKFLGLSICVYNIGCGTVSVLDYDEEYEVTFPNGYGRSILTVPWIELGGTVNISCKKSGYSATVEFITKPFYGNKKHRVMAEVYAPDDKKPFLSINGEWNGVMEAKWSDGDTEEFINVNKLSIVKKKVRPISQQQENESRRLWKEVTKGLKINDIDHATNAKGALEQKQRDEAKHRKDNNISWGTKLFNKAQDAEIWTYVKPLKQRLTEQSET